MLITTRVPSTLLSTRLARSTPHERSDTDTHPSKFQHFEHSYERAAPVQKQANKYPAKPLFKQNPCPLLHPDAGGAGCVTDFSSGSNQSYHHAQNMRSRDIVRTWLLSDPYPSPLKGSQHKDSPHTITRTVSEISMASSQASPVSEVFTNSSLPDDSASDTSSMMGSCILDNELPFKCLQDKTDRGPGCERGTQHDVGIQAQLQVGLCTSVPLTPANLQHYIDSYVKRPKHKPQRSRPKPSEPPEPKSGWARMLESTRKMEHETAIKMEQERRNGNEFAKWRSAMMPWM